MKLAEQCGSRSQVVFAGSQKDMAPYYAHARAFVLSSHFEGMPNALLEAMAHGVPSIVTPGFRAAAEIITHGCNGILLESLKPAEMAKHIVDLCQDSENHQSMAAAVKVNLHKFSPDQVFGQWRSTIKAYLGSS